MFVGHIILGFFFFAVSNVDSLSEGHYGFLERPEMAGSPQNTRKAQNFENNWTGKVHLIQD